MSNFVHQKLVVLHMFEKFNGNHTIETAFLEFVAYHIPSDDLQV